MTINNYPARLVPTQSFVRKELRSVGVSFKSLPETGGGFKVGGTYFTDDLQDALDTGRAMCNARKSPGN